MPDAATANLALPLLQAAQAQKHVTHNEALVGLDTLVQLAVLDKDLTAPPPSPVEGDRYLIANAGPTGAWSGWAGRVVRYQDGAWRSFVPRSGWLAFVADEADLYTYTGVAWASFRSTLTAFQNLTRLGIGTTADATNPFAAKLNKALWTALTTGEGGTGDLRYTLNKQASGNVLSLLLQSGFSGRAELGLTGDDDMRLKVSADGSTWREALRVDRSTGGIDLAAAEASAPIAGTVDLGALGALKVALTGAGTVTSFGTSPNRVRLLRFTAAATLTHNATSLVLPGGATIVTAAGDTALATSDASGNWTVRDYVRASGKPVTGPAAADVSDASASGRSVLTGTAAQGATALGLGTTSFPTFAGLAVTSPMQLTDKTLHLRSTGDPNHCLRYMGAGQPFGAANVTGPDGPVLHGFGGGTLGVGSSTGGSVVATWSGSGIAVRAGSLTVDSGGDGVVNLMARNAPSDTYRLGQIYKTVNIDGGSSWLFRSQRDDGVSIDHILPFNWPGRILTTGKFNPEADVSLGGTLSFGSRTTQHISLWGNVYGIGVQSGTLYARTDPNGRFCLFGGGGHSNNSADPGGGTVWMNVDVGQAAFSGAVKPASYTVATLPTAGTAGRVAWASNGRAYNGAGTLQGAGAGTGVLVTDDGAAWRVAGTNQTVQS